MAFTSILSVLTAAAAVDSALSQTYVGFDAAVASSTYAPGDFAADQAMSSSSGYWCSSGVHTTTQVVTWTGKSHSRHTVLGVKINWAYAPGEFKLTASQDGGNFEEAACWQKPSRTDASIVETVMFEKPQKVKALTIAMRGAMPWKYFGINDVTLIVEPYAFMVISGASSSVGELCLVTRGSELGTEPCLTAVANGDGHEIFKFNDIGQLVDAGAKCVTVVNGDASMGGKLALESCSKAASADDGRSSWVMTSGGQMKLNKLGDFCLDVSTQEPFVHACVDESISGADRVTLSAVPEFDSHVSIASKSSASLLKAAANRQSSLLAKLQEAMVLLQSCTLPMVAATNRTSALVARPQREGKHVMAGAGGADAAMAAIGQIYAAEDLDMASVQKLIADTAAAIKHAGK